MTAGCHSLCEGHSHAPIRHKQAVTTIVDDHTGEDTHDLLLVSKLLGHASVETTQRYVAMSDDRLRAGLAAVTLAV